MRASAALIAAPVLAVAAAAAAAPVPRASFDQDGTVATTEGHATLSWSAGDSAEAGLEFELQDAATERFARPDERYRGPDRASFVSGLPQGETWFRVRAITADGRAGAWSEPVQIAVDYPSPGLVARLFVLGTAVLAATVIAVAVGHRRYRGSLD